MILVWPVKKLCSAARMAKRRTRKTRSDDSGFDLISPMRMARRSSRSMSRLVPGKPLPSSILPSVTS
ncbi:hypothetical protein L195_g053638 [Trifolium pratense]|uniref:Uncharacterized protein n=1 Tax=Trifolium pratense TaxID=57577 RepID=A0A2K3KBM2_TRIPR|nr:hypothetical protein L195_g053638 [Trifolium pratense]